MSSLCFHSQSFPSLRQFLSCIDVASHYCKVPINPPFIRPRVLIHFFSVLRSLTLSARCCLIPAIFFPSCFLLLLHSAGNVKLYLCRESVSSVEGEGDGPREECRDPLLWGLKWEICLNASKALMVTSIGLRQREWYLHFLCYGLIPVTQIQLIIAGPTVSIVCTLMLCLFARIHLWKNAFLCVAWYRYDVACTQARIWKC